MPRLAWLRIIIRGLAPIAAAVAFLLTAPATAQVFNFFDPIIDYSQNGTYFACFLDLLSGS